MHKYPAHLLLRITAAVGVLLMAVIVGCSAHPTTVTTASPPTQTRSINAAKRHVDAGPISDATPDRDHDTADAQTEAQTDATPRPAEPDAAIAPSLGSVSYYTWIYSTPARSHHPIGLVRPGTAVALQTTTPVPGRGCPSNKWLSVQPQGFVCQDATVVLDLSDPLYRALHEVNVPRKGALPYRYAYSMGAPMYGQFPTEKQIKHEERRYQPIDKLPRNRKPRSGYEELAGADIIEGTNPVPSFAGENGSLPRIRGYQKGLVRKRIPAGSMLAFVRAVKHEGRTYLLTTDLAWVPADRVRVFRETSFKGVLLDETTRQPFGWTRHRGAKTYKRNEKKILEATGQRWAPRTRLLLTGKSHVQRGVPFLQTRNGDTWVRARDVSRVRAPRRLPFGVRDNDRWIRFSISNGTFELLEGKRIVFSTLASPGRGGAPPRAGMSLDELVEGSHTPTGVFRVTYKTVATTMTPEGIPNPRKHWIQDVPWTMYFRRPFAIHAAYWHEDFGYPKSGGCINLSPADAQFVFSWTAPKRPDDWSGVAGSKSTEMGTIVVVRR